MRKPSTNACSPYIIFPPDTYCVTRYSSQHQLGLQIKINIDLVIKNLTALGLDRPWDAQRRRCLSDYCNIPFQGLMSKANL